MTNRHEYHQRTRKDARSRGRFVSLTEYMLASAAWQALDGNSRALYIEVARRYTLVHAEQFLSLDGEGSITAPPAVRDSPHGLLNRRCGQTSTVCSGSKPEILAPSR
jgi:hypothetical protein